MLSTGNGCDSPSVSTTAIRVRASGAKKRAVARSPRAASEVPLPPMFSAGGGRWTAIASRSVTSKSARSSVGNRCGSTRSVSDAIPTAAVGVVSRSLFAIAFARSKRVGAPAADAASIDRDVSITMNTSASRGTFDASWDATTGWAAASASKPIESTSAASVHVARPRGGGSRSTTRRTAAARRRLTTNAATGTTTTTATAAAHGVTSWMFNSPSPGSRARRRTRWQGLPGPARGRARCRPFGRSWVSRISRLKRGSSAPSACLAPVLKARTA